MLRVLAVTESQEAQGLLEVIRRQPSVFVLSGPAIVITNVATASVFPGEGWSTESKSRVVRTARTRQEKHEKKRAEHAYCGHIHDEVTISDVFPATIQGLEEDENLPEDTTAQDDQEDETEQSLSDSLQIRRQISKIHENMELPSNRTLVRVFRLGGAKRRFILAAAEHSCGACEAQKRPAGPIVSRSPNSFVFNEVVGLDLFFLNTYKKHTLPAMNIVCWCTGLQCVVPLRDQSGETLRNAYRNKWLRSHGRPRILVVDHQHSFCSGIFADKVESDGTYITLRNTTWANCMLDNSSGFGDVDQMQPRNQQTPFDTRAWSSTTRWPQFGLHTLVPLSSVHDPSTTV